MKPTLTQLSSLEELMRDNKYIREHFILQEVLTTLKDGIVSDKQYRFILALIFNENYKKLNEVLPQIGFNIKI